MVKKKNWFKKKRREEDTMKNSKKERREADSLKKEKNKSKAKETIWRRRQILWKKLKPEEQNGEEE